MAAIAHRDVSVWRPGQETIRAPRGSSSVLQTQTCADLHRWAVRFPVFNPARFPALALTLSAHLPSARREDRALVGLVSLWIIAFDAFVDEGDDDPAALAALSAHFGSMVGVGGEGGKREAAFSGQLEQLEAALREICSGIAACNPHAALLAWWQRSFRATIAAIVRQRALGYAGHVLPGYDALLPLLLDSIGVRPYLAAAAIVGRDHGLVERLPALTALASGCALAIRLANDLRTWRKDESEGQVNTLVALRSELARTNRESAHDRALTLLSERLVASLAHCRACLAAATNAAETEVGMVRLASVTTSIYATHDYHTYRAGEICVLPTPD